MEQNKFDTAIKSNMEKRRLKPSEGLWDKLSERLDAVEDPKKKNSYWWLGIAASFVGILLVVFQFYKADSTEVLHETNTPGIVNTPKGPTENKDGFEKQGIITEVEKNKEALVSTEPDIQVENQVVIKEKSLVNQETNVVANSQDIETVSGEERTFNSTEDMKSFEDQKIKDIVNNVHAVAQNNQEVTEAYIDSLLLAAEKDILRQKFLNEYQGRVNAEALLADVESELDESFRTKVFEAVKSSFNSVKTAVANRNN
ncbi:hypothetical protein V8G61_10910 [Gaetbulibacter sp. M240]|uniref:hypothetical protein n=1 Tax=Gaetbulibacter sp. M240 TaxID=3126511 RepID=UPI00374EE603